MADNANLSEPTSQRWIGVGGANQFVHNLLQFVHSLLLWTKMTVDDSRNVANLMLKEPAR